MHYVGRHRDPGSWDETHTEKTDSATGNNGRLRLGAGIAGDTTGDRESGEDVGGEFEALFEFAIAVVSMT